METHDIFTRVAKDVAARYRGEAEADDIYQELWVWWLSHEMPDLSEDWASNRTLYTVAERYCKKERSARSGPNATYTTDEVFALVELLVNPPSDESSDRLGAELSEVWSQLLKLPLDLRGLVVRRAAGEPFRVVAEETGLSISTVHRRVHQALTTIVNALNGEAQA